MTKLGRMVLENNNENINKEANAPFQF